MRNGTKKAAGKKWELPNFTSNMIVPRMRLSSSSMRLFINEGGPISGHERVSEARLLLRLLV